MSLAPAPASAAGPDLYGCTFDGVFPASGSYSLVERANCTARDAATGDILLPATGLPANGTISFSGNYAGLGCTGVATGSLSFDPDAPGAPDLPTVGYRIEFIRGLGNMTIENTWWTGTGTALLRPQNSNCVAGGVTPADISVAFVVRGRI